LGVKVDLSKSLANASDSDGDDSYGMLAGCLMFPWRRVMDKQIFFKILWLVLQQKEKG
jgi:hypothetical protein